MAQPGTPAPIRRRSAWQRVLLAAAALLVSSPGWAATCAEVNTLLGQGYFVTDVVRVTGMDIPNIFLCARNLQLGLPSTDPTPATAATPPAGRRRQREAGASGPLWLPAPPPEPGFR